MTLTGIRPVTEAVASVVPSSEQAARSIPGQPAVPQQATAQAEVNKADLELAVEQMTRMAKIFNTNLEFSTHEHTGRIVVRVIDNESGQVLREIPPQKLLDAAASIQQALGLIFDERA